MSSNVSVVVGVFFGDEGKAKIVDCISGDFDYVVRYQGGDNAGHSVVVGDKKLVFQLIPSGILQTKTVIANGVVLNPEQLFLEIEKFRELFEIEGKLFVSDNVHIVFDWNIALDKLVENIRGNKVGTTGRGIGPTYAYKSLRLGARALDLLDEDRLSDIVKAGLMFCNPLFEKYGMPTFDPEESVRKYFEYGKKLSPFLVDTTDFLNAAVREGKKILFEGGQGLMLDLDLGTYPFVTSSNIIGSLVSGTGLPCSTFGNVIGVVKSYSTRVGNGDFITEIFDEQLSSYIREKGNEFGSVTGRKRRIGWLDLCAIKRMSQSSGMNAIALTSVDVLNGLNEVYVCYDYEDSKSWEYTNRKKPVYKKFKGWNDDYSNIRSFEDFSQELREFVNYIREFLNVQVKIISYGKSRSQALIL